MLRNYRDFGSNGLRSREQADEDTYRILPREGKIRMRKKDDESKMTPSYTSRTKALGEDNYFNSEFRHVQPKNSPRTSVKLTGDGKFIKDKEEKRCTPSLVARLMGLDTFPPLANKQHHEQREMKSKSSTFIDSEECKDVFEVTEISKSKKQEYRPYRQSKVDLKLHDIDLAYAKRRLVDETDMATGGIYCDILEDFNSNEDCYIKFLEEPRVFKKHASHTMFSGPSNESNYYIKKYDGRPSRYLRGHVSSHRKHITNVVGRHKKEDHHSTPVVLLKPGFDKVRDMIKTIPSARFLNKDQYKLRKREGFHVPKRCVMYAGEGEMHSLYSDLGVTSHDSNRIRKIARQVTERLKNNGYIRDESSHESYKSFQWTNDDDSISNSSCYSSGSVISKEAKKRLSDRFKMIQQYQRRSTGKSHGNLQEMLVSDRERSRTNSNKHNISNRMTSNSIPLSSSFVYQDIKHAKRNTCDNMVLDKRQNDFLDVNLTPRESTFHNLNLYPTQVYSSKEESEMSEREIHVVMDEMYLPPKVNDEEPMLLDDRKPVQHTKGFSLQTTDVESSTADFCGSAIKKKIDGSPQISPQFHTQYEEKDPVSLLEPTSSDDDQFSSECFQKLSADIKELQTQLKLLKSKSLETNVDESELAYSDEDIKENTVQEFNDDEDRDYSYLLDVLIYSGIHSTNANDITNPLRRELFERLEKKYNVVEAWSISERMLLFDHIREIISDVVEKSKRCVWAREDLVEEIWQVVVKQRKEQNSVLEDKLLLDPGWLNLEHDVYVVVIELERMLTDEAMDDFIGL